MVVPKMSHKRMKWAALMCCLLPILMVACVPKAAKERSATLIVQPAIAKAGAVIVLNGSQFLPNEEVEVILTVGNVYHSLGTGKADSVVAKSDGTFEVSSGIPVKTPPGTYKMTATGSKGSTAVLDITVTK